MHLHGICNKKWPKLCTTRFETCHHHALKYALGYRISCLECVYIYKVKTPYYLFTQLNSATIRTLMIKKSYYDLYRKCFQSFIIFNFSYRQLPCCVQDTFLRKLIRLKYFNQYVFLGNFHVVLFFHWNPHRYYKTLQNKSLM